MWSRASLTPAVLLCAVGRARTQAAPGAAAGAACTTSVVRAASSAPHASQNSDGMYHRWAAVMAAAAAGGLGLLHMSSGDGAVQGDAKQPSGSAVSTASDDASRLARLRTWLSDQGVDMSLVEVRPRQDGAGLGMFVASDADPRSLKRCMLSSRSWLAWLWPFDGSGGSAKGQAPLVSFPLRSALTADNIVHDSALGRGYAWMLERGVVDERTIIMAYLIVERLKGSASHLAPWMDALPNTFDTPLVFTPEELGYLQGTPLSKAAPIVLGRLRELWARMQPALSSMLAAQRGVTRQATFEDLLWAYNVFWSRGQSLPVPRSGAHGAASALLASDPAARDHDLLDVHEGVVPGLDFCNHDVQSPRCWWEVMTRPAAPSTGASTSGSDAAGGGGGGGARSATVQLRLFRGAGARAGDELCISYGDKSNEELLMLYGFAVRGNPHDHIMLHVPLPPSTAWDDVMHARVALIRDRRHELQFFLPSPGASGGAGRPGGGGRLPLGLLETLEVFVLTPAELAQRLEAAERVERGEAAEGDTDLLAPLDVSTVRRTQRSMGAKALADAGVRLGVRLGALAAAVKLLEARVEEQEGASGSGTLEEDGQMLLEMESSKDAQSMSTTERRRFACLVYRYEQKRIAREYLVMARTELHDVMSLLNDVGDLTKKLAANAASR